jgi:hypothetical protein
MVKLGSAALYWGAVCLSSFRLLVWPIKPICYRHFTAATRKGSRVAATTLCKRAYGWISRAIGKQSREAHAIFCPVARSLAELLRLSKPVPPVQAV